MQAGEAPAVLGADRPFHLEAHLQVQAVLEGLGGHAAGERPLAAGVDLPLLCVTVDRRPGPAGLSRERGDPLQVGDQPQVAAGAADVLARGDGVVDEEDVEHRRHPDAPAGGALQPSQRDGLGPCDAGVVDPAQCHHRDARVGEPRAYRPGPAGPLGPQRGVQYHGAQRRRARRRGDDGLPCSGRRVCCAHDHYCPGQAADLMRHRSADQVRCSRARLVRTRARCRR